MEKIKDRDLAKQVLLGDEDLFRYIDDELKTDEKLALSLIKENFEFISRFHNFDGNKEFYLKAIHICWKCFGYASEELSNDYEILEAFYEKYKNTKKSDRKGYYDAIASKFLIMKNEKEMLRDAPKNSIKAKPIKF